MRTLRAKVALALILLGTASAGVAIAAWTGGGEGTGYAKAARFQALTTKDASASTRGDLYPGGKGDLVMEWHNPNNFPVRITEISAAGPIAVDPDHPACVNHGIEYADQRGLSFNVGAGESKGIIVVDTLTMSPDADDGCQGAGFTLPVAAKGIIIIDT
jgi:hypothetical protein